jgi:hypothetical protein
MTDNNNPFDGVPVIHRYTRAQAIEDGVLIELTPFAKEVVFRFPVACTIAVWNKHIVRPPATRLGELERARVFDLIWCLRLAILRSNGGDTVQFEVVFLQVPQHRETITLKAVCGPGDNGEPVITVLCLDES